MKAKFNFIEFSCFTPNKHRNLAENFNTSNQIHGSCGYRTNEKQDSNR